METGYEAFSFYYDQLTENVEYPQRAAYFHKLIQKYRQSEGVVLLDLACGTGSLSEEFAKLGYDVLGVDYSYGMLNQAMQKKLEHNLPIQYICQDMRELDLYGTVDITVCALDSLNHLDSFSDVQTVFQQVFDVTEPGERFAAQGDDSFVFQHFLLYVFGRPFGDTRAAYLGGGLYGFKNRVYIPDMFFSGN